MPLDVLGRTRATLTHAASLPCPKGLGNLVNVCRDRDRLLQLLILNEEFLVNAGHQLALITSLPFVHTARRSYRLDVLVKCSDRFQPVATLAETEKIIEPSHLEEGEVVTRFP